MSQGTISANLVRLRKVHGLSQEKLAANAGLSRAGYRKIEKGQVIPQANSLRALATALEVPIRELVSPAPQLTSVRFRALKRLRRRDQVLYEVGRWLQDLNELEALLKDRKQNSLLELRRKIEGARGDMPKVAEIVRGAFKLSKKEPVHDICGLLESKGIKIWSVEVASDAFFGLSVGQDDGGPAIVINTWDRLSVEWWIYSAAHELAHLLLHLDDYVVREMLEEDVEEKEKEANEFASHFLMPESAFRSEWDNTRGMSFLDRVMKVKRMFRVSWRTVVYRVAETAQADHRQLLWQRFAQEFKRRYGRSISKHDEPDPLSIYSYHDTSGGEPAAMDRLDFRGDRLPRLVRQAVEAEQITLGRAAEILAIPLEEMRDLAASWVI
ncbi:MAG: ImmA/IrrE family metallo-endopeptidase [Deltaproteobacteria bacterium]|nr:ImmA/IrrE family metallo-endopeptidase [Deltaproteobacteria bacterium]